MAEYEKKVREILKRYGFAFPSRGKLKPHQQVTQ
jgi:hypothetical protein